MTIKELRDFINDPEIKDDDEVLCVEHKGNRYADFNIERFVKRNGVVSLNIKRIPKYNKGGEKQNEWS